MTYNQHIASSPELSVWVSASAGTGKTKVLTDRVLRLLLAGREPHKILCITYTKAAAAEMEHRIEAELGNWAIAEDGELFKNLTKLTGHQPDSKIIKRARQLFAGVIDADERIRIQTIHGFCQSILKRFPLEAGVPPHFKLIDDYTARDLLNKAKISLLQNQDCSQVISSLADIVSEYSFNEIIANIINDKNKFAARFEEKDGEQALIEDIYNKLDVSYASSESDIFLQYFNYNDQELAKLRNICALLEGSESVTDRRIFDVLCDWLQSNASLEKFPLYIKGFLTSKYEPRAKLLTKNLEKKIPQAQEILLTEQRRVVDCYNKLQSWQIAKANEYIIKLAKFLLGIYKNLKDSHAYLDYDDIILYTVNLLHKKDAAAWVLYKLDGGIDHILIDEAQDTAPEQWQLVNCLVP